MFGFLLIMNSTRFISPLESHDARRCVKYMQKNPGNVQLSKQGGFSAMAKFTVQPPDRHETTVTDTDHRTLGRQVLFSAVHPNTIACGQSGLGPAWRSLGFELEGRLSEVLTPEKANSGQCPIVVEAV